MTNINKNTQSQFFNDPSHHVPDKNEKAKLVYSSRYHSQKSLPKQTCKETAIFKTHTSIHAERLHKLSEASLIPGRFAAQLLAHLVEPLAGKDKNHPLIGLAKRVAAAALLILSIPFIIPSLMIGIPLRLIDHQFRPAISYIDNSSSSMANSKKTENLVMTQENPLHIRSHNLGFVSTTMSIAGDLRDPIDRAKELVISINGDNQKPDIIVFQETFHEDATRVLCEGIKNEYPYIIHSVAPSFTGFNSGALIASKYPVEEIEFQTLGHMLGPEKASPRGIIKVQLTSPNGPLFLYGIHTQALIGEERAQSRFEQLKEIKKLMEDDLIKTPQAMQVLVGDFNTSRVTAWGEDNKTGEGKLLKGQSEAKVLDALNTYFDDPFIQDHDELTGLRKAGSQPIFLDSDNQRMGVHLEEPSGSWFHGPFADPGFILSNKMKKDRKAQGRGEPEKAKGIKVDKPSWGTPEWHDKQTANTARFDYILLPKDDTKLSAVVEIRRPYVPKGTQSASSDHLPVDAQIWRK